MISHLQREGPHDVQKNKTTSIISIVITMISTIKTIDFSTLVHLPCSIRPSYSSTRLDFFTLVL